MKSDDWILFTEDKVRNDRNKKEENEGNNKTNIEEARGGSPAVPHKPRKGFRVYHFFGVCLSLFKKLIKWRGKK